MNFSQKLGLFILIVISVLYVYFSFFNKDFQFPDFIKNDNNELTNFGDNTQQTEDNNTSEQKEIKKVVKIFILDKSGNLRSVDRTCDMNIEKSCYEFAIKKLMEAPTTWEKSKGFTSEIPQNTKLLSVRESASENMIDLSSSFESGGGTESIYYRIKQLIKTVNANSNIPTYLYINGKKVDVIGGEGIIIKQPLNERSIDG